MLFMIAGCGPQRSVLLGQAVSAYNAQQYTKAHHLAVSATRTAAGIEREQAAYLAGLSAYQLGNLDEAELRLTVATRSSDKQTAASAKAMLGQVRLDQNRPHEAAALFDQAAQQLAGNDAAQARRYAAIARNQPLHASGLSGAGRGSVDSNLYAIQVGAFSQWQRANEAASRAERIANRLGLGPVDVISSTDAQGQPLYLVQFGRFASRDAAIQMRTQLGQMDYHIIHRAMP